MPKEEILRIWHSRNNLTSPGRPFFNGAELPIAFYYTDQEGAVESECGVTLSRAGFTS